MKNSYKNYFNFKKRISLFEKASYILQNKNKNIYNKTIFKHNNKKFNFNQNEYFKIVNKKIAENNIKYITKNFNLDSFIYRHPDFLNKLEQNIVFKNYDVLEKKFFIDDKNFNIYKSLYLEKCYKNEYLANNIMLNNKKDIFSYFINGVNIKKLVEKNKYKFIDINANNKILKKGFLKNLETEKLYIKEKENKQIIDHKQDNIIREAIIKTFEEENFFRKYSKDLDYEFIFDKIKEMIFEELIFLSAIEV